MAWPVTTERLTTYVGGSSPPIYAADLNSLQDYLARIYQGTRTVIALTADGTGDTTVTPISGQVKGTTLMATGTRSSGTAGSGQSLVAGTQYKDTVLLAWGHVTYNAGAPVLQRGVNISSLADTATGVVTVTLVNGAPSGGANDLCVVVTGRSSSQDVGAAVSYTNSTTFVISIFDDTTDGASQGADPFDNGFTFVVFGG